MSHVPRMRTRAGCIEQLRADDPNSDLTPHALYRMIRSGDVPAVKTGNRYLVNYDKLLTVLSGESVPAEPEPEYGQMRAVR